MENEKLNILEVNDTFLPTVDGVIIVCIITA